MSQKARCCCFWKNADSRRQNLKQKTPRRSFFGVKKGVFDADMATEMSFIETKMIKRLLEKWFKPKDPVDDIDHKIWVYPSNNSCVKHNMSQVKPEQMPPLMVRKAAWRR